MPACLKSFKAIVSVVCLVGVINSCEQSLAMFKLQVLK